MKNYAKSVVDLLRFVAFLFLFVVGLTSFGALAISTVSAQGVGGVVEGAIFRVLGTSGSGAWRIMVDSSNTLRAVFMGARTAAPSSSVKDPSIDRLTGAIAFPGYTAAQLATLAVPASGYMLWQTDYAYNGVDALTNGRMKISTGSGPGAWTNY